ncbi:discoidin domain-containing protein [Lentzea sp. BCCO 10_0856]|uniref:Discoidin domain-containing protein n=1 Tax=Lentzea miocenica TaxID=3095431 RepID=A0ABU4TCL2_9PSEU|nr:discoidin domain-containing protein [Lentzea sp. BCCO 10_0856]MDX8035906.1 discoidin domain-containing protein [Lentzea sp. BCCO 10_0856]
MRLTRQRTSIALAAASVLTLSTLVAVAHDTKAALPPPPAGWTQVFGDDFTGPANSLPNGGNWRFSLGHGYPGGPGNWGTGEIAAHTSNPANVSLDGGGNLRITPRRDGAGNWTSARIETNAQNFKAPNGGVLRMEARIQMPNVSGAAALGYWPAFWALGSPYRGNWWNWPGVGEFDIMENVNGVNRVWGVLHCGVSPGGPCNEKNGIANSRPCPGASCQGGFHAYRFEWDASTSPQQLRWYVDGELFHQVNQNQLPADTWNQMTGHAGYFIILNVAIGGEFPDNYSGTRTPGPGIVPGIPMVVDHVGVWTRGSGGGPTTTTTPPPTCGPVLSQNRPTSASSVESGNQAAAFAVDGSTSTRWSSAHSEPHWWQVDLGSSRALSRVRINWEAAYGRAYSIQLSDNGSSWRNAYTTATGAGGVEDIGVSGNARYVRFNGMNRGTVYGFSFWEFEVFGACGSQPTTTTTQPPDGGAYPAWASGTAYAAGSRVSYAGLDYQCLQGHTSITTWEPPNAASLWQRL